MYCHNKHIEQSISYFYKTKK